MIVSHVGEVALCGVQVAGSTPVGPVVTVAHVVVVYALPLLAALGTQTSMRVGPVGLVAHVVVV